MKFYRRFIQAGASSQRGSQETNELDHSTYNGLQATKWSWLLLTHQKSLNLRIVNDMKRCLF